MSNPNQNDQNQDNQGGQQQQGGQNKPGQQQGRPSSKVASSRAGRTSPVSRVVSSAEFKLKGPAFAGPSFSWKHLQRLGSFCFLIDGGFGDLGLK